MLVPTTATSIRVPVRVLDVSLDPIESIAFDDADLAIHYRRPADASWQAITLVSGGTTWVSGGWREISDGIYELCIPNTVIVSGEITLIRLVYDTNPALYDRVEARLPPLSRTVVVDAVVPVLGGESEEVLYFEVTALDDYEYGSTVGAIGPIRLESTLALDTADASRFGATQQTGTNRYRITNHFEGTVTYVPVSGMPNFYDAYIDITDTELNVEPGTYAWDIEVDFGTGASALTRTILDGLCGVNRSMGDHSA